MLQAVGLRAPVSSTRRALPDSRLRHHALPCSARASTSRGVAVCKVERVGVSYSVATVARVSDWEAAERQRHGSRLAESLAKADAGWRFVEKPQLGHLVNWSSTRSAPIHRWLRYREAYSAELIEALNLGRRILDPFCGCGSMLVGAAVRGRSATGIDINPLAAFTARVKTTPLTSTQLGEVGSFCAAMPGNLPTTGEAWVPELSIADKVFEPAILITLLRIRTAIMQAAVEEPSRDFLRLAWTAILETVGSYFKEGNGIKYRNVQRRPGKYVRRPEGSWQLKRFGEDQSGFVIGAFSAHLRTMIADAALWTGAWGSAEVIEGNALDLAALTTGGYDSIVFSPPYANRFDYFESMKVELWFGEFVKSSADMRALRKSSLRSHLSADMARPKVKFEVLEDLIAQMDRQASSWRMGVPELLRGYFSDIIEVLKQCRERLQGGACYVVVGNSAFGGTIIPSDTLTAIAGEAAGFRDIEIWVARHLTVAPQQRAKLAGYEPYMRESIVVLRP